ncbi:Probable lipoprotein Cj1090c [hydrothermal vent metagenome]|uniref:Probable lipoprotein Cj1090c n=1 Tax=hydrothermal vent metagenome TaxID=652676 RepID=A0A1W1BAR5_9ZZZZ
MMQKVTIVFLVLLFASCGYKPSARYARDMIGDKVSTSVSISKEDPENSVLVKDAVDTALIDLFHTSLSDRAYSDTHLDISLSKPSYTPIQYDENGFVIAYRMRVTLYIKCYHDGEIKNYSAQGYYDFAVEPNAVVTDQQRFEAIRNAAQKAIVAFVAQISSEGARRP